MPNQRFWSEVKEDVLLAICGELFLHKLQDEIRLKMS
jgi:hypothetical protein